MCLLLRLSAVWSDAGMAVLDSHEIIRRQLRGETVNGEVGVRLRGGPSHGRIKIVGLDNQARPPAGLRVRHGSGNWHAYLLDADATEPSAWVYLFSGEDDTS
ncbi:hypothetical protein JCM9533A_83990 [Catenuloplanes niger JCM 9533]